MITINTKQNKKGNWLCYATVKGYDFSFEGENYVEAQLQMVGCIKKNGLDIVVDCQWILPKDWILDYNKNDDNTIGYKSSIIDNL